VTCFRVNFTFTFTYTEANFIIQDYAKKQKATKLGHYKKAFNLQRLCLQYNIKMISITEMKGLGVGIIADTVCRRRVS